MEFVATLPAAIVKSFCPLVTSDRNTRINSSALKKKIDVTVAWTFSPL